MLKRSPIKTSLFCSDTIYSMPFSEDDKALIKKFTLVPTKNWMKGGLDTLLKKVKETGSTERT